MPRYELALLFPNGKTRHVPSDGKRITKSDVKIAQSRHKKLAVQIASFHDFRRAPKAPRPTLVASGWGTSVSRAPAQSRTAPPPPAPTSLASAAPPPTQAGRRSTAAGPSQEYRIASLGKLLPPAPQPVTRSAPLPATAKTQETSERGEPARRAAGGPSASDRMQLASLFALASLGGSSTQQKPSIAASAAPESSVAERSIEARLGVAAPPAAPALSNSEGQRPPPPRDAVNQADLEGWSNGFVAAPAYDEEHPEELFYRPFPLAPLLTSSASADDPVLAHMQHPDITATLDLLDEQPVNLPMRFTQSHRIAELLWSQQFTGTAVNPEMNALTAGRVAREGRAAGLASRSVKTSLR